jgi:tRNA A37 methylthiotransferase MiaB
VPITTDGVIEGLRRFRRDKLAVVALVGCMGQDDPAEALERLRAVRDVMSEQLTEHRRSSSRRRDPLAELAADVYDLAVEVEPWLAQVVGDPLHS